VLLLLTSLAMAATHTGSIDMPIISNAPPTGSGRTVSTIQDVGSSPETRGHGPGYVNCSWSPLAAEIRTGGELYLTLDPRAASSWPSIPSTATCTSTYAGDTYTLTVNLVQQTHDYAHEGEITNWTTGAQFYLGSYAGIGGDAWNQLPTYTDYTAGDYGATKSGSTWTGVNCHVANAQSGNLDAVRIDVGPSAAAGSGSCTIPRAGGPSLTVPIAVTR
jgi:hypothetical protein